MHAFMRCQEFVPLVYIRKKSCELTILNCFFKKHFVLKECASSPRYLPNVG